MPEYGRKPVQGPALRPPLRSVHPAAGFCGVFGGQRNFSPCL